MLPQNDCHRRMLGCEPLHSASSPAYMPQTRESVRRSKLEQHQNWWDRTEGFVAEYVEIFDSALAELAEVQVDSAEPAECSELEHVQSLKFGFRMKLRNKEFRSSGPGSNFKLWWDQKSVLWAEKLVASGVLYQTRK
jgi:hypothetical protein